MKKNLLFAAALFVFCLGTVCGQTAADIEAKYKKYNDSPNAYSVSERIWMTPEYSASGEVCRMNFRPKSSLPKELPLEEFVNVFDSIISPGKRGAKKDPFAGGATGGGVAWMTFKYERVFFTFSYAFGSNVSPVLRRGEYTFSGVYSNFDKEPQTAAEPEDDFHRYGKQAYEVAAITWSDRRCAAE